MDNFLIGEEALNKVVQGHNKMADAVKITLGGQGKLALIKTHSKFPDSTKDGVRVLKEIRLDCPFESLGAARTLEASEIMLEEVGDNTTSAIVIAQELIKSALNLNKPHTEIIKEINTELNRINQELIKDSKKATKNDIKNIATISANNDLELGDLISKAFNKVGKNGQITVEESEKTELIFQKGMKINKGWVLPHFITNTVNKTSELKNVNILLIEGAITSKEQIQPAVLKSRETGNPLLLFCEDIHESVMPLIVESHLNDNDPFRCCIVFNPSFGENKKNILKDIAIYTQGKVWEKEYNNDYIMGFAKNVTVGEDNCYIFVDEISEDVKLRTKEIEAQIKIKSSENLISRLAAINNNVAIIKIKGNSMSDISEKKDRLDDAIKAVKSVSKYGFLPGGGLSLYSQSLNNNTVWKDALQAPIKQILLNGGIDLQNIKINLTNSIGYNIVTNKYENFYESGILDSTAIVLKSLETASNLAITIISTNILITN
jgi:chaperonin GroEL